MRPAALHTPGRLSHIGNIDVVLRAVPAANYVSINHVSAIPKPGVKQAQAGKS